MKNLEDCYEINFWKINFIERKTKITDNKTIITGASKTGKSYLIYDFLSSSKTKDYIYIDFKDLRNDISKISKDLEELKDNIQKRDELQEKAGYYKQYDSTIVVDITNCKTVEESTKEVLKFIQNQ